MPFDSSQSSKMFDPDSFPKYMHKQGKAYHNQAMELIAICRLFSQVAKQGVVQDAELTKVLERCDEALLHAANSRGEHIQSSDDDIENAIRELEDYELEHKLSSSESKESSVKERMNRAKDMDKNPRKRDPSSKTINFHIMKNLTDPKPTIVQQVLNKDTKLQEILWNFSRFPPESHRRLSLSQNPHFYDNLPTSSANWGQFEASATQEGWHNYESKPICVLTRGRRVFLERLRDSDSRRAFDNVWKANETLIFKRVYGILEGESIIGEFIQTGCSRCHVEDLASEPETAVARPNQNNCPSKNCVSVETWIHELCQALFSQENTNVKIRIRQCPEPTRGYGGSVLSDQTDDLPIIQTASFIETLAIIMHPGGQIPVRREIFVDQVSSLIRRLEQGNHEDPGRDNVVDKLRNVYQGLTTG